MKKRALAAPLIRAGLIAGILVTAILFPVFAAGGLGTKAGIKAIEGLPKDLRSVPSAQTTYVYAADGKTLMTIFYEEYRRYTPLAQMSPYIQEAIVSSEDGRFYKHHGVDIKGVARAFVANQQAGGVSQGGSTLTMQYVRMALRDSARTPQEVRDATEQTTLRKIREMKLALELEKQLSKPEILERYLNGAYFGHRAYGVFAAAQVFFSKLPKDLTLAEAALIAGLVKAPTEYDPATSDRKAATERRNYVVDRMVQLGYVSAPVAESAKREPIKLRLTNPPNDCISVPAKYNQWGFFCDYLKNWWMSQPAFGDTPPERADKLRRGGYSIVTSLDPKLQQIATDQVMQREGVGSSFAHGLVVVQPGTGQVKAMAVNRVYGLNPRPESPDSRAAGRPASVPVNYPNTVNALLGGGGLPGYQAGSTFKMFTMLAALEAGMPLSTTYNSPHRYKSKYILPPGAPKSCGGGYWCPSNASGAMTGLQTMWSGFGKSVNTYFVQLEQEVGADRAVRMAERLGLRWRTDIDKEQASPAMARSWGAFTLGVADTTPLEMANAYAAVAADGRYCDATPVLSITSPDGRPATYQTPDGQTLDVASPRCRSAVQPAVARAATDAARCVTGYGAATGTCGGWSTAPTVYGTVGRPVAGKTGTTDETAAAWFVGYTPQLAAASFIADPDNPGHLVGDANASKPVESVALTLRVGLARTAITNFRPPPERIR